MLSRREFLGWSGLFLHQVADYLFSLGDNGTWCDLGAEYLCLPGNRAGYHLTEALLERCAKHGRALIPPRIVTVGDLPELFYCSEVPVVGAVLDLMCWVRALQSLDEEVLKAIIPNVSVDRSFSSWVNLARNVQQVYVELHREHLSFADVAQKAVILDGFHEESRWMALDMCCHEYMSELSKCNVIDKHTARDKALNMGEVSRIDRVILIGQVELLRVVKEFLSVGVGELVSLINAPESCAEYFDEFGCGVFVSDDSKDFDLSYSLSQSRIVFANNGKDQAELIGEFLSSLENSVDDVTIGVVDPEIAPFITDRLLRDSINVRTSVGESIVSSTPYQLLTSVYNFLMSGQFGDLASIVRHPDVDRYLKGLLQGVLHNGSDDESHSAYGSISALDIFHERHLPGYIAEATDVKLQPDESFVIEVFRLVNNLIGDELCGKGKDDRLTWIEYAEAIARLLRCVYGGVELKREDDRDQDRDQDGDRKTIEALERIWEVLAQFYESADFGLGSDSSRVDGKQVLGLLLSIVGEVVLEPVVITDAVSCVGWLELPLDDSRVLCIAGLNEGIVPGVSNEDLFLPDGLRVVLGLSSNECRLRRDRFLFKALLESGRDVFITAGRYNLRRETLLPSRLLLYGDPVAVATKIQQFYHRGKDIIWVDSVTGSDRTDATRRGVGQGIWQGAQTQSLVAPLTNPVEKISATGINDYLACPFRFYLKHCLHLDHHDDRSLELDGAQFGTIGHDVLRQLALDPVFSCGDAGRIYAVIKEIVREKFREQFGSGRCVLPAVPLQIQQLEYRLEKFAYFQASWASCGWRLYDRPEIRFSSGEVLITVPEGVVSLVGSIDRVDVNEDSGKFMIIDYKFRDAAKYSSPYMKNSPIKNSAIKNSQIAGLQDEVRWRDLQLPIYKRLFESRCPGADIGVAYLPIDGESEQIKMEDVLITPEMSQEADQIIRFVASSVITQRFWPPAEKYTGFDPYAAVVGSFIG